jgi:hypothetical protein
MSAGVTKGLGPRRFIAWCEFCQDGMRYGVPRKAHAWAANHNRERHGVKP